MESILIILHLQVDTELLHTQLLAFAHLSLNTVQGGNYLIVLFLPIVDIQQGIKRIKLISETYGHTFQQLRRFFRLILLLIEICQSLTVPIIAGIILHSFLQCSLSLRHLFQEQIILSQFI